VQQPNGKNSLLELLNLNRFFLWAFLTNLAPYPLNPPFSFLVGGFNPFEKY